MIDICCEKLDYVMQGQMSVREPGGESGSIAPNTGNRSALSFISLKLTTCFVCGTLVLDGLFC
jgi:hypothetical protein